MKTEKENKREIVMEVFLKKKKKRKVKLNGIIIEVYPMIKRERLIEYHQSYCQRKINFAFQLLQKS